MQVAAALNFSFERLTPTLLDEAYDLLYTHWDEIAHYRDLPLDPDRAQYLALQANGVLRAYSVRVSDTQKLVGYAVYFVRPNPHYVSSGLCAAQDILYIHPDHRGIGHRFIPWCDEQLRAEGVRCVYQHSKLAHDIGPLLTRLGYEPIDTMWGRRLDR